ncbi:MAG: hypothetical protein UV73_C0018G0039 [Candidatus Gottesmanbacteria bacterium GW2011_GWA2_43_14]|uniref:Cohesin domain-containing protein n=1 Tax=Candidatus Gottesmanbacteria bacterium GW2011_GWA2_43_14 TaxID=1618443 RepID=A0A0G1FJY8_9BACT|nr:MAG: hypothetical protein UV73_C0018G0039 [Candidatus Gottesmanbacteria bacterium GW2011_GWA2_43_14]
MKSDMKKILVVVGTLVLLLVGIFYLRNRQTLPETQNLPEAVVEEEAVQTKTGVMRIIAPEAPLRVGEAQPFNIVFTTENPEIFGSDAVLLFNPEYLTADDSSVVPGAFYREFPRINVDRENGVIKITAYSPQSSVQAGEEVNFFAVNFTGVKSGATELKLDFIPGSTNTTTLVDKVNSANILGSVENLNLTVTE